MLERVFDLIYKHATRFSDNAIMTHPCNGARLGPWQLLCIRGVNIPDTLKMTKSQHSISRSHRALSFSHKCHRRVEVQFDATSYI